MLESENKVNRLEEIKKKLYSRNENLLKKRTDRPLHEIKYGVSGDWTTGGEGIKGMPKVKVPPTFFKKFFLFSVAIFLIAVGFVAYKFYGGSYTVSSQNIRLSVLGNSFAAGGEDLPLQIEIANDNNVALELADLLIEYPKGSQGGRDGDFVRIRKSLGNIGANSISSENIKIVLFGEQGSIKEIKASLEYRLEGSNAIFVKEATHAVNISSSPVNLVIQLPENIVSGQEMLINVRINSNVEKVLPKLLLRLEYPPGFTFTSSNPESILGDNVWNLGDLAANAEKNVLIKGRIIGEDREERTFHAFVGEQDARVETTMDVIFNSLTETVVLKRPFIQARLLVNSQDAEEYSVSSTSSVNAEVRWSNNLPTRIDDVEIKVKLSGNALDKRSISAISGFYNSLDDTITWDRNTQQNLSSIEPGETGSLRFTFKPAPLLGSSGSLISEPTISAEINMRAKQPTEGNVLSEINNIERKTIRVNTDLQLATKALYASGPFQNTGSIPPKAEERTTYTLVWTVTNTANSAGQVEAKATLPSYVKYLNITTPPFETVTYNEQSREIIWRLGTVARGAGFSESKREAAFQVELTPSLSQIGSVPQLLSETVLTSVDNFTRANLKITRNALSTRLMNDTSFRSGDERVIE